MPSQSDTGRSYHLKCTGKALETVRKHTDCVPLPLTVDVTSDSDDMDKKGTSLTLFAACFCPFVQRVWVALEFLGIPYRVCARSTDSF